MTLFVFLLLGFVDVFTTMALWGREFEPLRLRHPSINGIHLVTGRRLFQRSRLRQRPQRIKAGTAAERLVKRLAEMAQAGITHF
jgi:hypothetical protein